MESKEDKVWRDLVGKEVKDSSESLMQVEKAKQENPEKVTGTMQVNDYLKAKSENYRSLLVNLYDLTTEYLNASDFRRSDLSLIRRRLQACLVQIAPLFLETVKERGRKIVDGK